MDKDKSEIISNIATKLLLNDKETAKSIILNEYLKQYLHISPRNFHSTLIGR